VALQGSSQRMEPKARQIHILRGSAPVQHGEDIAQLLDMVGRHPLDRSSIE